MTENKTQEIMVLSSKEQYRKFCSKCGGKMIHSVVGAEMIPVDRWNTKIKKFDTQTGKRNIVRYWTCENGTFGIGHDTYFND